MSQEIYKRYRPEHLRDVIGQTEAVSILKRYFKAEKLPQAILLTGPSGCGKTTIARIIKKNLGCSDEDFREMNSADDRGINDIRAIRRHARLHPINGPCRIWLLDEAHKLSSDAQEAMLKLLEDTPANVYFLLATTNADKLLKTIRNRCTVLTLSPLDAKDGTLLLKSVAEQEGAELSKDVIEKILEVSDGSARKMLVVLDSIIGLKDEEAQLTAIMSADAQKQGIDVARALFKPGARWADVATVLKTVDEEPETIRHIVLGYANAIMLGGGGKMIPRAMQVIESFRDHWFDCKKAGLIASCYEVINSR